MSENEDCNAPAVSAPPAEMMAAVRLLVLDIDGAIVDESNRVRDSVAQAVRAAQRRGVAVALATGRLYQTALLAYDSVGSTAPLICYEGALIREPETGLVHQHRCLDRRALAQVLEQTEPLGPSGRVSVHFHIQDDIYVSNLNGASLDYFARSKVEPIVVSDLRRLLDQPTTKVMVLSDDVSVIARLSNGLKDSDSRTRVKQDKSITLLEAFHPTVNKRSAVSYLAEAVSCQVRRGAVTLTPRCYSVKSPSEISRSIVARIYFELVRFLALKFDQSEVWSYVLSFVMYGTLSE